MPATLATIGPDLTDWIATRFAATGLGRDDFALALHRHAGEGGPVAESFAYRGDVAFYPCSVVKMFFMAGLQHAYETGALKETPELARAMADMIRWSSNTATNYIIDHVTGTTGDTELPAADMGTWRTAREAFNRYFASLGIADFANINLCQKLMDDDRYGREKIFVTHGGNNHNRLTASAAAALLARIMAGEMISADRSAIMRDALHRPTDRAFAETPRAQILGYLGEGMPAGTRIWSKAGWTGWTGDPLASYRRHDALHAVFPDGQAVTMAVFTQGERVVTDLTMLPQIGAETAQRLMG